MGIETLATAALVAGGLSTATSIMGDYAQGQAQKRNADYQSQVAAMNSTIAKQNATYTAALGQEEVTQQQQKAKSEIGDVIASQGANGLDVNSGSNLRVQTSAEETAALDASRLNTNTQRNVYNYEQQAANETSQSNLYRIEGESDVTASYLNMGSSLLGGASSVGNQYLNYQRYGYFNGGGGGQVGDVTQGLGGLY